MRKPLIPTKFHLGIKIAFSTLFIAAMMADTLYPLLKPEAQIYIDDS